MVIKVDLAVNDKKKTTNRSAIKNNEKEKPRRLKEKKNTVARREKRNFVFLQIINQSRETLLLKYQSRCYIVRFCQSTEACELGRIKKSRVWRES